MESSSLADWTRGLSTGHAGKLGGDPGTVLLSFHRYSSQFHKVLTLLLTVHFLPPVHLDWCLQRRRCTNLD